MADGWGGSRTPANPSMVSAPGALSSRTDGGVLNPGEPEYGEKATLENFAAGAPLAGGGAVSAAPAGGAPNGLLEGLPGLGTPTSDPSMPVTAGAALGAGPGVAALGLPQTPGDERRADVAALGPAQVQVMIAAAQRADATPSYRKLVRQALYA